MKSLYQINFISIWKDFLYVYKNYVCNRRQNYVGWLYYIKYNDDDDDDGGGSMHLLYSSIGYKRRMRL